MQKNIEDYKQLNKFIENYGKPSKEGSNSSNNSFFIKEEVSNDDVNNYKTNETNKILENLYGIPNELAKIYKIIGNPYIEYYFGEWILKSLINLIERRNIMLQEKNKNVVDFGIRYCGMGHCVICSYDPEDSKIFFRRDGGSNGYERVDNWNFIKSYTPEHSKKHNFNIWLDKVENEYNETEPNAEPWLLLQDPMLINP